MAGCAGFGHQGHFSGLCAPTASAFTAEAGLASTGDKPPSTPTTPSKRASLAVMPPSVEILKRGPRLTVGAVRRAEWVRVTVPLPHGPVRPLRLMHLSDLHLRRRPHPVLEQVIARLESEPFDAVLITGDFVDDKFDSRPHLPVVRKFICRLRSRWGTFGVLGNHDGDLVRAWLSSMGVVG